MYADREGADNKLSAKDRLIGSFRDDSGRRRQIAGKRQRQDDKWEHDLYEDDPQVSSMDYDTFTCNEICSYCFMPLSHLSLVADYVLISCEGRKVDARDLRLKLQRKVFKNSGTQSISGVRDLRDRLSGTMNPQPMNTDPPKPKVEAAKPARRSIAVGTPAAESKKAGPSVDEFLTSLDLEKYSITFQAEEVDMTALVHMTDEDLKALGIPMGPRKKILLALESRV
ncbi:hypothetical protein DVH24_028582 [Malus domestica]|uniref:SAM domain-containing protein n=1 Tax=Malus domestica TaxID=3750 RepID=A0A498IZC8_MALDO|nr:hypothetical protein DVH24_028582 [Malus domestica]